MLGHNNCRNCHNHCNDKPTAAMSKGEFVVFKSVVQFVAPRLLGFDMVRSRK